MAGLNQAFAEEIIKKLERVDPGAKPIWGKMTAPQMIGHLRKVLQYTMGEGPSMPFRGNWFSRHVLRHLIVHQVVAMPKNVRLPRPKGMKDMPPPAEATTGELLETLHEYLERHQRQELPSRVHPFFGELGPEAWNKLHVAHFKHHLKQFGVW